LRVPRANRRDPAGWNTAAVVVLIVNGWRQRDRDGHTVLTGGVELGVGGVDIVRPISVDHVVLADDGKALATVTRWYGPTEQTVEEGSITVIAVTVGMMSTGALAAIAVTVVAEHHSATAGVESCDPLFTVLWLVDSAMVCLSGIKPLHDPVPGLPTVGGMTEVSETTMIGSCASVPATSVCSVGTWASASRPGKSTIQAARVSISTMATVAKEAVRSVAKQPMATMAGSAVTVAAFAGT